LKRSVPSLPILLLNTITKNDLENKDFDMRGEKPNETAKTSDLMRNEK
jgi:hypothetical protein